MNKVLGFTLFSILLNGTTLAQVSTSSETVLVDDETLYVIGSEEEAFLSPGSATFIGNKELQTFSHTDINRVLKKVSGVYIQEEDGYGLRPNIGLRGAHPHRSKKVTIMEDGILIGPAPYSAPAAYYFPLPNKMTAIEVFKGPSAIKYGPNSIGGAVNLVTRPIPKEKKAVVDISLGELKRYSIYTGGTYKDLGTLIEVNQIEADGFKELPNNQDTGFTKHDIMFKQSINIGKKFSTKPQKFSYKLNYSDEDSKETYLGLTDNDFSSDPYQRYSASQNDHMKWYHREAQARYTIEPTANIKLTTGTYLHRFFRNWSKLNGFTSGPELKDVMADPTSANEHFYNVVRGISNSTSPSGSDNLVIGNNERTYESKGVFLEGNYFFDKFQSQVHNFNFGLRYHVDTITRNHTTDSFSMLNSVLTRTSDARVIATQNTDKSRAFSAYVEDEISIDNFIITAGTRVESVDTSRVDHNNSDTRTENDDFIFSPGLGVSWQVTDEINLIAGANKGVTLVAPGQADAIEPEKAINYEAGIKYNGIVSLETIGFYSDYENIKGTCSFSSGCTESQLDKEFNGGEADIYGLELVASKKFNYKKVSFPTQLTYTYTKAQFSSTAESTNTEWGIGTIRKDDPMPYIPEHKASASVGFQFSKLLTQFNINWTGKMADQAVSEGRKYITGHGVIDWVLKLNYSKESNAFIKLDNILNNEYAVSLRPYGVRPGKPRMLTFGIKQAF